MQEWIRRRNIAEFHKLLLKTTDPDQRRVLLQLLAEEEAKVVPLEERHDTHP